MFFAAIWDHPLWNNDTIKMWVILFTVVGIPILWLIGTWLQELEYDRLYRENSDDVHEASVFHEVVEYLIRNNLTLEELVQRIEERRDKWDC